MGNRIFVTGVFLLWIGSMSWLVIEKLAPSLNDGTAPSISGFRLDEPVGWHVEWSGEPAGSAISIRQKGAMGTTQLQNRVILHNIPLLELAPTWMRSVIGEIGALSLDVQTLLEFDTLDNFSGIRCRIGVNGMPTVLTIRGHLKDSQLNLTVRSGQMSFERTPELMISDHAALSEALFPDARLPYLYVGRTWSEEVFNPFLSPNSPIEIVQAEVVSAERLQLDDQLIRVLRVEYRSPSSPGIPDEARLQAVAWVDPDDGTVLRQDVHIAGTRLRFSRMSPESAKREAKRLLDFSNDDLDLDLEPQLFDGQ